MLYDIKGLHRAPAETTHHPFYYRTGNEGDDGCHAVNARSREVHAQYVKECRRRDAEFFGTPATAVGPFLARLRQFPDVVGLVFRTYAEASQGVHTLVENLAQAAAPAWMAHLGAANVKQAKALLKHRITEDLGVEAARSQADLLITRLGHCRRVHAGVPSRDLHTAPEAAVAGDRDDGMAAGGVHLGYGAALERHARHAFDAISVVGAPGILVGGP